MKNNQKALLEPWEFAVARRVVREGQAIWTVLAREATEDLLQEVLIHWLEVRDAYDVSRDASLRTFMRRVLRHRLADLRRRNDAAKRRVLFISSSLDAESGTDDAGFSVLVEGERRLDPAFATPSTSSASDLRMDIEQAMARLTARQREICLLLLAEGSSMRDAMVHLKVPRTTFYREVGRIREVFVALGLLDYL